MCARVHMLRALARMWVGLRPNVCVCTRLGVFAYVCVRLQVCIRGRNACVCTFVRVWARERARVCVVFFRVCATMPDIRRLGKKNASNSLANKDKVKLFSVHKLHTQAFLLVPKSSLYLL